MNRSKILLLISVSALTHGCATITSDAMQSVNLTATAQNGEIVADAQCKLSNDEGNWTANTPASVQVHRSAEDLQVECTKEGQPKGILKAISRAAGSMFGNIVFGGGIGAIIDHNTGKGYNYPDHLPVKMGESVIVDRRIQDTPKQEEQANK